MASPRSAFAEWKESRDLSSAQVAARLEEQHSLSISRQMIDALLTGERNTTPAVARALGEMTGLDPWYFIESPSPATAREG